MDILSQGLLWLLLCIGFERILKGVAAVTAAKRVKK